MNTKHRKLITIRKDRFPAKHKELNLQPSWLKWLTPAAKVKAKKKLLRRLAAARSTAAMSRKVRKSKVLRPPHPRFNPNKVRAPLDPYLKDIKGVRVITDVTGLPGNAHSVSQYQFVNSVREWLQSYSSEHGDFIHPTNHSFVKVYSRAGAGSQRAGDKYGNYSDVSGDGIKPYPSLPVPSFDNTVYNDALGRLYTSIRGDVDLSIDLAEVHKTKAMMNNTMKGMRNLLTTFRKMRRSNPLDWGDLWLEFTYGWKPLASSIYGAGHRLLLEPKGPRFMSAHGSAKGGFNPTSSSVGNGSTENKVVRTIAISEGCRMKAQFSFTTSALDSLAGFSSLNPVSIVWELTPYSFVVDWFVDVGGYLRNFETACLYGSDFVAGYVDRSLIAEVSETNSQHDRSADGSYLNLETRGYTRVTKFQRTVLTSVPFPKAPRFDPKLGSSRLVSAAALLGQMVPSLKKQAQGQKPERVLSEAQRLLNAPKGASMGPFSYFFR